MSHPSRRHGRDETFVLIRLAIIVAVFVIAVAARWPSCGESFWVDELHTAWCISGTFDQVGERAAIGNQQPLYFAALALWHEWLPASVIGFYGIEATLRATSVLLTAVSAAWLVVIVSGRSPSFAAGRYWALHPSLIVGGSAAGLSLGLDRDGIFFGTELRPYAAILFVTTAALALGSRLISPHGPYDSRPSTRNLGESGVIGLRGWIVRVALHGLVLIAAAIHVTSLIVLAPQLLLFAMGDVWQHRTRFTSLRAVMLTHGVAGIAWGAVAVTWFCWNANLWQSRGNWHSFGTITGWGDVWQMWPWTALVILPMAGWAVGCRCRLNTRPPVQCMAPREVGVAALILAGVIGSTTACYLLSAYAGIPLWHRRYLIAALPLLCAVMGWFIAAIDRSPGRRAALASLAVALMCLVLLTYQQGTLGAWSRGDGVLARRGENWKSAVAFVRNMAIAGDRVWIDAGLIEQQGHPTFVTDPKMEPYLRYVTGGPYRLGEQADPIGIGRDAITAWLRPYGNGPPRENIAPRFLITRRRSRSVDNLPPRIAAHRFGTVTVFLRQ